MTTTLTNAGATVPDAPTPDHFNPSLPELYRILSELIENPEEFFDNLIQLESKPDRVTVRASHLASPLISFTEVDNPLDDAIPRSVAESQDSSEQNTSEPKTPGPLEATYAPSTATSIRQIFADQFKAAMLHRTRILLEQAADAATIPPLDPSQWHDLTHTKNLLTAATCVFYAADIAESLDEYTKELSDNVASEIESLLKLPVIELLERVCPNRPFPEETEQPMEPHTFELASRQAGTTIRQYNKATLLLACSTETFEANIGAAPWIVAQNTPNDRPCHQGQFIGQQRASAITLGMTPRSWTRMTKMDPHTTRAIINCCTDLEEAARIINWITAQGQQPNTPHIVELLVREDVRQALTSPKESLHELNIRRVATLSIRRKTTSQNCHEDSRQTRQHLTDALTYAYHTTTLNQEVTATTWGGVIKAVNRWHRQMDHDKTQYEWDSIVKANNGIIRSWQPIIQEFEHADVKAVELTDESMLLKEALDMNHCIHLYGAKAEQGLVRIFSLLDEADKRATASVYLTNETWKVDQTRGSANHAAPQNMQECTRELASACNQDPLNHMDEQPRYNLPQ